VPVFRSGQPAPPWSEVHHFEIVRLDAGEAHTFERLAPKERLVVGAGACRLVLPGTSKVVVAAEKGRGDFRFALDAPDGHFAVSEALEPTTLIRIAGDWGDETGGYGVFAPRPADGQPERGDPVTYPKTTAFDNHYHDCDEYWIVFEGRGVAYSERRRYEVGPGDCIATGAGYHHDFSELYAPVRAVFLETTLVGARRRGHLWEHTHGPADPREERR
jgi:mannose-6-phosphate isomerase-like protein (cupin superfamily)